MENFEELTPDEIRDLPEEEKREFIRKLVRAEDSRVQAVFFNPVENAAVSMHELALSLGEEKAIDIIITALEEPITKATTLNREQMNELLIKVKNGEECTEEEKIMLNVFKDKLFPNYLTFQEHLIELIFNLTKLCEEEMEYRPELANLISVASILSAISLTQGEDTFMKMFSKSSPETIIEMVEQVGDDIYDTWKASCDTELNEELVFLGLLQLATKIAKKNNYSLIDSKNMSESMGLNCNDNCDNCEGCDCCCDECDDESENGSNPLPNVARPVTHNSISKENENKEMKDLLKD